MDAVIAEIAAERKRQVDAEGWTPEHDDMHSDGQMAKAAACYAGAAGAVTKNPATAAYVIANPPPPALGWPWRTPRAKSRSGSRNRRTRNRKIAHEQLRL